MNEDLAWLAENVPPHGYFGIRRSQMRSPWDRSGMHGRPLTPNPTPFVFEPNNMDFWETELNDLMVKHTVMIFQDSATGDYQVRGEGIRLRLPMKWLVTVENADLVQHIITGIKVSLAHREHLNY